MLDLIKCGCYNAYNIKKMAMTQEASEGCHRREVPAGVRCHGSLDFPLASRRRRTGRVRPLQRLKVAWFPCKLGGTTGSISRPFEDGSFLMDSSQDK